VNDVGGDMFFQAGPQRLAAGERGCDTTLALVALPCDLTEQRGRFGVSSGRVGEDAVHHSDPAHHLSHERGEAGQLGAWILIGEQGVDLWAVRHRH